MTQDELQQAAAIARRFLPKSVAMAEVAGPPKMHSYHDEKYAWQLLSLADRWNAEKRRPFILRAEEYRITAKSLKQMLDMARKWVLENAGYGSEDQREAINGMVTKERGEAVDVRYSPVHLATNLAEGMVFEKIEDVGDIRAAFIEFLSRSNEHKEKELFERTNLILSDDDVLWFHSQIAPFNSNPKGLDYLIAIDKKQIKVIKYFQPRALR